MPKVTVDDGVEVSYYLEDFTDPWGEESDTILMHHGSGENAKFLIPMVPALARRYRVLRFDARGRGDSSAPPEGSTLSGEADDDSPTAVGERCVKDALSLIDQLGIQKVHFLGVASGGVIGIHLAVSHPDRIKSLILCTLPYKLPREVVLSMSLGEKDVPAAIEKFGNSEWTRRSGIVGTALDVSKAESKLAEWELTQRQRIPTHVYASFWKWVQAFDYSGWLGKIKAPTLLLAADKSAFLEQQRFMKQQIPKAKFIVFDGVGTGIHLLIPDRVTDAVLNFLQTVE